MDCRDENPGEIASRQPTGMPAVTHAWTAMPGAAKPARSGPGTGMA
ncbi:MAG TPA: hypothetical protein VFE59_34825 [Trebonia sp.]|nr:hypothetical protein [Trebonia sp.]